MSNKHTPGPWTEVGLCIVAANGKHVFCFGHDSDEYGRIDSDADRDLIAAAPELLEAVERVLQKVADDPRVAWYFTLSESLEKLVAAFAKARGRDREQMLTFVNTTTETERPSCRECPHCIAKAEGRP